MAMNAQTLGKAIAAQIIDADAPADMKKKIEDMWVAIAGEIVDHITNNAQVKAGIPVSTTGSSSAQTGATTAPGTIM